MKKLSTISALIALCLAAGSTLAASSSPATGDWSGRFSHVSPKTSLTFSVAKKTSTSRVVGFASNGSFKMPCGASPGLTAGASGIPSAKVTPAGKFTATASLSNGFGNNTTTVSGKFKSKRAAAGTVVFVMHVTPSKTCKLTVHWSATFEPPAPPIAGASYTGATSKDQAGGGAPVTFHVSANGRKLTRVSFRSPAPFHCGGFPSKNVTGHNVPIRKGKFTFKTATGNFSHGTGIETQFIITGQFLSLRRAAGTVELTTKQHFPPSPPSRCVDTNTWTAHAG